MSPVTDPAPEPDLGLPPQTDDADVNAALRELVNDTAGSQQPAAAKVAAATRAHQRLQAILTADRD